MKNLRIFFILCLWYTTLQGMNTSQQVIRLAFQPNQEAALLCFLVRNPECLDFLSASHMHKKVVLLQEMLASITTADTNLDTFDENFAKSIALLQALLLLLDTDRNTLERASRPFSLTTEQLPALQKIISILIKNNYTRLLLFLADHGVTYLYSHEVPTDSDQEPDTHEEQEPLTFSQDFLPFMESLDDFLEELRQSIPSISSSLVHLYPPEPSLSERSCIERFAAESALRYDCMVAEEAFIQRFAIGAALLYKLEKSKSFHYYHI